MRTLCGHRWSNFKPGMASENPAGTPKSAINLPILTNLFSLPNIYILWLILEIFFLTKNLAARIGGQEILACTQNYGMIVQELNPYNP